MIHATEVNENYLDYVLNNLRDDDRFEMMFEFGEDYIEIIKEELKSASSHIQIIVNEINEPLGIFGYKEIDSETAEICLLVTDEFKRYFKDFIYQAKTYIAEWMQEYSRLENFVYKHNKQAMRWLKILGFQIVEYDDMKMYFFTEKVNE